ncbi:MAG: RDD family protein [Rhodobacteraceae bacterium]|jgi:uncharacterized RDD family membrane protein YckC|nr:RDD family protein [Paracoccaceae bacterium]
MDRPAPYPSRASHPDPAAFAHLYAGVTLKRGLAWVFDALLILLLVLLALPFTAFTGLFYLPVLWLVVGFLYRWVTLARGSATPGMRFCGIEFRAPGGERLDAGLAGLHTLGYTLSVAMFPLQLVSIASMLVSRRGQGLTDHILGTVAVNR